MILNKIKQRENERGFTIVELLIVIVIIAVLAAITIVAYTGITARAKTSSAQSNASAAAKKAEVYASDGTTSKYPVASTDLTGSTASGKTWFVSGMTLQATAPTSTDNPNIIQMQKCGTGAPANQAAITTTNITGVRFVYYDYVNSTTANVAVGDVAGSGVTCP